MCIFTQTCEDVNKLIQMYVQLCWSMMKYSRKVVCDNLVQKISLLESAVPASVAAFFTDTSPESQFSWYNEQKVSNTLSCNLFITNIEFRSTSLLFFEIIPLALRWFLNLLPDSGHWRVPHWCLHPRWPWPWGSFSRSAGPRRGRHCGEHRRWSHVGEER